MLVRIGWDMVGQWRIGTMGPVLLPFGLVIWQREVRFVLLPKALRKHATYCDDLAHVKHMIAEPSTLVLHVNCMYIAYRIYEITPLPRLADFGQGNHIR